MNEMTDRAKTLALVIDLMDAVEQTLAVTNAIAGGLVTDPETIRENAATTAEFLQAMLDGNRLFLDNPEVAPGVAARDMFNFTYED